MCTTGNFRQLRKLSVFYAAYSISPFVQLICNGFIFPNSYFIITSLSLRMQQFIVFFIFCCPIYIAAQTFLNVDLFAQHHRGDTSYSGSWYYVAPDSTEYALLGARSGTVAYRIGNSNIQEVGFVPGLANRWREITVIGHHAYVTNESDKPGNGMHVIDLSYLPDSLHLVTNFDSTFQRAHIIQRDIYSDLPYVYVCGTQTTQGIHILDVSNPTKPKEIGVYNSGYYIHDCHVKGDRLYAAAIQEAQVDVVDISDKTDPQLIATIEDPGGATHSSWLTEDNRYLFVSDEQDGLPGRIWNIEDINDPTEVATWIANSKSLTHNPYIRGKYAFISHNTEGLRVVDLYDPTVPVEVGYYDTWSGASGGFHGLWSACPFLPSGRIIGGNREDGIYIWEFNNARAGRFYGQVCDSVTGNPVFGVALVISGLEDTLYSDLSGRFKGGYLPDTINMTVTADGYLPQQHNFVLAAADSLMLKIQMMPSSLNTKNLFNATPIHVYPNPAKEYIVFDSNDLENECMIEIYDVLGKTVGSFFMQKEKYVYSAEALHAGVYMYVVRNANGQVMQIGEMVVKK